MGVESIHTKVPTGQIFEVIDAASSGDNTLVAAISGQKIRVLSYTLLCDAATLVRFESGASGTALTGRMSFGAMGGVSVPFSPVGHFETAVGDLLNLELDIASPVTGHITYMIL